MRQGQRFLGKLLGPLYKRAMHIVLVDDSIPFDAESPATGPLGGAEKSFASLPGALAARGHRVQVFNRAAVARTIERAAWETWQGQRLVECDILIAFRKPELLGFVATARQRVLWLAEPATMLDPEPVRGLLYAHRPALVFMGEAHAGTYRPRDVKLKCVTIAPGIRADYLAGEAEAPRTPPYAVATSHPLHGLEWLLRLWLERVVPACPHASLRVYSATLARAVVNGASALPDTYRAVADLALGARERGVALLPPGPDPVMAEAYRGARVHLYPGSARGAYAHTLGESQAAGVPGVARPLGAASERIGDGVSGYLEAGEDGFALRTLALLEDDGLRQRLGLGAKGRGRGWDWNAAAAAFEAIWR